MTESSQAGTRNFTALLIVIGVAGLLCLAGWYFAPRQFYLSMLAAAMLPWSISVGSLALLLIFSLTGGKWGRAAWPWLVLNARLIPWVGLLFIPFLWGITSIYPWANPDYLAQFENTENRQWFYQTPFFVGRTLFYFLIWTGLSFLATGLPRQRFRTSDQGVIGGQGVAGLGLLAILLTVTWAIIDWVMSFDPFFASTLFGMMIGMGALLSGISATVAATCFWNPLAPASRDHKTIGDLSSLMFAFLMLWAYLSFSHFLIMWSGNLSQDAQFYEVRNEGLWGWITPAICIVGFVVPFLCLLSYDFKRSPAKVGALALGLLAIRQIELCWMVLPSDTASGAWNLVIIPAVTMVVCIYLAMLAQHMRQNETLVKEEVAHVF